MYQQNQLAYQYGKPKNDGFIKQSMSDFKVTENLNFELDGEGEHDWVYIEKTNINTQDVVALLAKFTGVLAKNIGYSGLKDKQAVTKQWFSLYRPGKDNVDWKGFVEPNIKILNYTKHTKKLKRGTHKSNTFELKIRLSTDDFEDIEKRIQLIKQFGFVNYFGEQRFGHHFKNGQQARQWLQNPKKRITASKRSLFISTLRSEFFNLSLSNRILANKWLVILNSDNFMLQNSQSFFKYDKKLRHDLEQRLQQKDISICHHLLGALKNTNYNEFEKKQLENEFSFILERLIKLKVSAQQRAIRADAIALQHGFIDNNKTLTLHFSLAKGQYATSLIREVVNINK